MSSDFDVERDMLAVQEWLEIDRYALAMTREMVTRTKADYDRYEYHPIVARLQTFASEDLGAFYLDILKDRLYTTKPGSKERRSAQCALYLITEALLKLMAPLLSFTAEEAWKVLKKKARGTIFTETFPDLSALPGDATLVDKWTRIRAVRAEVQKKLEPLRERGEIGSSLQAEVEIRTDAQTAALLQTLRDDLKFVLITSGAHPTMVDESNEQQIVVTPSANLNLGGQRRAGRGGGRGVLGEAALERVAAERRPVLVGNSGSSGWPSRSASQARSTATVCLVSGVMRCLRPLPRQLTCAPAPRCTSPQVEADQLGGAQSGLGGEQEEGVVAAAGPGAAVGGGEQRVELGFGEERDQRAVEALGRDRQDALDRGGVLGVPQRGVAEQRADRGQARVAGAGAVVALVLEVIQERADQRRVEIVDVEVAGRLAGRAGRRRRAAAGSCRGRRRSCAGWRCAGRSAGR